ncbi:hypothetical protein N7532_009432 [Penicillium argentinense]|uniref:Uncharacterized protein n=1 Tax=Penicillium argentinense TaxID=1131581 RepID=A0A9W9K2K3_9EURO|nr:uncharacterized protein N7532_009432 [Penicillium argentinense]KAJ5090748.1 hypothetical protein N7532_009432 [Penicillium argentinense]
MHFSAIAAASILAVFSQVQYAPAPFAAGLGLALGMESAAIATADGALATLGGGAIAGGVGQIGRRMSRFPFVSKRVDLPPGVSQESYQQCQDQLNGDGVRVEISGSTPDTVHVKGLPPACMNLATVITGDPTQEGGPVPTPMGSDSLDYSGVSEDNLRELGKTLQQKGVALPKAN